MLLPRSKTLALWAGLVSMAAFLVLLYVYAQRAAFHSDELNVLHHVSKFASGDVGRPGRPGLLWFLLTPLMALDDPVAILRGARLVSWLAVATSCLAVLFASESRRWQPETRSK